MILEFFYFFQHGYFNLDHKPYWGMYFINKKYQEQFMYTFIAYFSTLAIT